jgi:hypothetical protein
MNIFSSSPRRRPRRFRFAMLAVVVIGAAAIYGMALNQPWPT